MGLTFANKVTVGRILAVPFFIATVLYYSPQQDYLRFVALGIFLFAVVSDAIDGYIARHWRQKTRAGAILDPLADKFLLISAFICLYKIRMFFDVRFPMWLVVGVISRDVILILGSMIIRVVNAKAEPETTIWGKATAFFQTLCVLGVLLQWPILSEAVWYPAIVLTIISGVDYIRRGIKMINNGVAA